MTNGNRTMTELPAFDAYAEEYDAWFLQNLNVLASEKRLIAHCLDSVGPGRTLSVGCGSGLFEMLLREQDGMEVGFGVEPSEGMAAIARKRGMEVAIGGAESLPYDNASFDTVLFNGTPSYIEHLEDAFAEAHRVLRPDGFIVVADVPAESSYGLLYRLATVVGSWDDPFLRKVAPRHPYPIEFAAAANWRMHDEKCGLLEVVGFVEPQSWQTLTCHPKHSDEVAEDPSEGADRGDYVAIIARKRG